MMDKSLEFFRAILGHYSLSGVDLLHRHRAHMISKILFSKQVLVYIRDLLFKHTEQHYF